MPAPALMKPPVRGLPIQLEFLTNPVMLSVLPVSTVIVLLLSETPMTEAIAGLLRESGYDVSTAHRDLGRE